MIQKKVCILGPTGVGKTSLIKQFVEGIFSEKYKTTIGVKIDKKEVQIGDKKVNLLIWDIAGEDTQSKVPPTYKLGAHAIIYVFDLTRPATYEKLPQELKQLSADLPSVPLWLVGNKSDLLTKQEINMVLGKIPEKVNFITSAKTSEQVLEVFFEVAKHFV